MDLNLFENLKKHIESNDIINNFIEELGNFLKNTNSQENNVNDVSKNTNSLSDSRNQNLAQNRKEGHLYLVTEDRNNEIYLWDFTDKSKTEFKETGLSDDLLNQISEDVGKEVFTSKSIKVAKTYIVKVDGKLNDEQLKKLTEGIEIEKGKIAYCDWAILEQTKQDTLFEIVLYQGLNRQIRKMFEFLGYNVINLKRIRHANIELTGLKKGQIKQIKPRQIKELKSYLEKIKEEQEC